MILNRLRNGVLSFSILVALTLLMSFGAKTILIPHGNEIYSEQPKNIKGLFPLYMDSLPQLGTPFSLVDDDGQVLFEEGRFITYHDVGTKAFAFVGDTTLATPMVIGINSKGDHLFNGVPYDNGVDGFHEGLIRVTRNGYIGYADSLGRIVIPCNYECAGNFKNDSARVASLCVLKQKGEHLTEDSRSWIWIDKTGNRLGIAMDR